MGSADASIFIGSPYVAAVAALTGVIDDPRPYLEASDDDFDKLVARGKTPLQAYVAVMRKLLHAIYGMFSTRTNFVAAKFHAAA